MKKLLLLILLLPTCLFASWEIEVKNVPGFNYNWLDTHSIWNNGYLWVPESEIKWCDGEKETYSSSLIRVDTSDPDNWSVDVCDLPFDNETTEASVYEVIAGSDPNTYYVSTPYGADKSIFIVDVTDFPNTPCTATQYINTDNKMFNGGNGAKMALATVGGEDYIWTTGLGGAGAPDGGYITKWKASDNTIKTYDYRSVTDGLYGVQAVPTTTQDVYTIYAAGLVSGELLMMPSDADNNTDSDLHIIDFQSLIDDSVILTSMKYDGEYVWIGIASDVEGKGFLRYKPSKIVGVTGSYTIYWVSGAVLAGILPTMMDFAGHMWMTVEETMTRCEYVVGTTNQNPQLLVLDKSTLFTEAVLLSDYVTLNRASAALGHDDTYVYVGGYGYITSGRTNPSADVLNLLRVTPQDLTKYISFGGVNLRGLRIR